jgi:hypothetical protein
MASTGILAWEKHFKNKQPFKTKMKKASTLYDERGSSIGQIPLGGIVDVEDNAQYSEKYPVVYNDKKGFVTFNNISKPISKSVSGIKLKPQDFASIKARPKNTAFNMATALNNELLEREDLPSDLILYASELVKYWGALPGGSIQNVKATFSDNIPLNEIKKDFGELLGAFAVCNHNVLSPDVSIGTGASIDIPLRGNEPLVDYYINTVQGKTYSISAKSGTITNTLKAADILTLLKTSKNKSKYPDSSDEIKFLTLIDTKPVLQFPFYAVNLLRGLNTLNNAALEQVDEFTTKNMSSTKYDMKLFEQLYKLIGQSTSAKLSVGELFYKTEKYVVQLANQKINPTSMFNDATSGVVIYVKYDIVSSIPQGSFSVVSSNVLQQKNVKWRSKNYAARAGDKIGLQP